MSLMPANERTPSQVNNDGNVRTDLDDDEIKKIPLNILHPKLGIIWERTGTPITALAACTIGTVIMCTFMTYELVQVCTARYRI